MEHIERFSPLLRCTSAKLWQESLFQLGKAYGFEHALFGISPERPNSIDDAFIRGNFSSQWLAVYKEKGFLHVDPRLSHCENRFVPLLWEPTIFVSRQQKEMYEEASTYGLCSGIALPMHTSNGKFGMLYFATKSKPSLSVQRDIINLIPELSTLRDFALESSLRFTEFSSSVFVPAVTPSELECLKWCAAGKSSWETAQILGCTEAAVNFHFSNLRRKFQTSSRNQVVVKAVKMGLLSGI
jgi:LuxR family quorum-sensing transcriptional regulator LasR